MRLLEPHDFLLGELLLVSILILALGICSSVCLQVLVDRVVPQHILALMDWLIVGLLAIVVSRAVFAILRGLLQAYLARRLDADLLGGLFEHLVRLPMSFFDGRHAGDIATRFLDAGKIRDALAGAALILFIDIVTLVGGASALAVYNIQLALKALAIIPVAAGAMWLVSVPLRGRQRAVREQSAIVQSQIVELSRCAGAVKALNVEAECTARGLDRIAELIARVFRINGFATAALALGESLTGLILVCLVRDIILLALRGSLSVGAVVACYSILGFMLQPVVRLFGLAPTVQDALASIDRVQDIFDRETEALDDDARGAPELRHHGIEVKGLSFRYGLRGYVLRDVSLSVPSGTSVAIVGPTGSGKSTLAKLLVRFYDCSEGTLSIGGQDLRSIPLRDLRRLIGYVDQNAVLINESIAENVRFFDSSIPTDSISEVLSSVGLRGFVDGLPEGMRSRVGEAGAEVSGGERQLLSLARVLLRNPPVLVLDEAFSQVDSLTEARVSADLRIERVGKTTIQIVHRLEAARLADVIFVLEAGRIVETGSHDTLVSSNGAYAKLWSEYALSYE